MAGTEFRRYLEAICADVLLVGKPSSGKSTALERLLVQEAELALGNAQTPIPVLLKDIGTPKELAQL